MHKNYFVLRTKGICNALQYIPYFIRNTGFFNALLRKNILFEKKFPIYIIFNGSYGYVTADRGAEALGKGAVYFYFIMPAKESLAGIGGGETDKIFLPICNRNPAATKIRQRQR